MRRSATLTAIKQEPFFLFISYIEPHHQNHLDDYPAPIGYEEQYTGRWTPPDLAALGGSSGQHLGGYYGMVKRLDEALGRLLDALRSLNLLDDTVVLFTSDHGCHFKTRNSEYKRSCHESSIRCAGRALTGGGQLSELVSLIDLPPTLLDAAGLPIPDAMEGRSILPLVRRQAAAWPEEVFVQISESQVARAIRTARWKYCVNAPDGVGWRDAGSDHYVEEALYDLHDHPTSWGAGIGDLRGGAGGAGVARMGGGSRAGDRSRPAARGGAVSIEEVRRGAVRSAELDVENCKRRRAEKGWGV